MARNLLEIGDKGLSIYTKCIPQDLFLCISFPSQPSPQERRQSTVRPLCGETLTLALVATSGAAEVCYRQILNKTTSDCASLWSFCICATKKWPWPREGKLVGQGCWGEREAEGSPWPILWPAAGFNFSPAAPNSDPPGSRWPRSTRRSFP